VEERRLVVVERVAAVLLDRELPIRPLGHRRGDLIRVRAWDELVLAAEVEQRRTRDRPRRVQRVRDARAVVADDRVRIGCDAQAERELAAEAEADRTYPPRATYAPISPPSGIGIEVMGGR
jgi:hypothetical protein